jgi:hypothetical protein
LIILLYFLLPLKPIKWASSSYWEHRCRWSAGGSQTLHLYLMQCQVHSHGKFCCNVLGDHYIPGGLTESKLCIWCNASFMGVEYFCYNAFNGLHVEIFSLQCGGRLIWGTSRVNRAWEEEANLSSIGLPKTVNGWMHACSSKWPPPAPYCLSKYKSFPYNQANKTGFCRMWILGSHMI